MSFGPPAVAGYSAFYDPTLARPNNGAEANYAAMRRYGRASTERHASMALTQSGFRAMRRVLRELIGVAPGATALDTYARVRAENGDFVGGARVVETVTTVNAPTTADQVTYLNALITDGLFLQQPASYPVDLSGNGGGGKLGR